MEEAVKTKVEVAIERLLIKDVQLFKMDVNERSISHRLAMYLQDEFPSWDVDCEHNCKGHGAVKRLDLRVDRIESNDTEARTVFPDIIVHHRASEENLLVIEIKKTTSQVSSDQDKKKLKAFKDQLGYCYALFLKLTTGANEVGVYEECWL